MVEEKAAEIRLLVLDVDGVLTDGKIIINDRGEEIKYFDGKDGQGIRLLTKAGLEVAIISGRKSKAVEYRAKGLDIKELYQGIEDKASVLTELIRKRGLSRNQVCCMGDDIPDIPMFRLAGLSVTVADAVPEVLDYADYITTRGGGNGAVREACELILKAQGKWSDILSEFTGHGK